LLPDGADVGAAGRGSKKAEETLPECGQRPLVGVERRLERCSGKVWVMIRESGGDGGIEEARVLVERLAVGETGQVVAHGSGDYRCVRDRCSVGMRRRRER
jgi:hypothetical protein